jgi:hypothetical protein
VEQHHRRARARVVHDESEAVRRKLGRHLEELAHHEDDERHEQQ